jgi:hypothetical protein
MPPSRRPRVRALRRTSIAVLGAVVAVGLAGCGHSADGLARLSFAGQVFVSKPGGTARRAHNGQVLGAGDRVRVAKGQADISLASSGVLQLRAGSTLTMAATPTLNAGDVLIQPSDQAIQVAAGRATLVVASGAAQLAVDSPAAPTLVAPTLVAPTLVAPTLVAKVYRGTSKLDVAGHAPATIAAPREVDLSSDTPFPVTAVPLRYSSKDAWDVLFLGEAVGISSELAAAAAGFNAQVPATMGNTASFYQQLEPMLDGQPDFVATFDAIEQTEPAANSVKPGDYLIASVIALQGKQGSFARRLISELTFSAQGAPWGFVAYDQGVMDLDGVFNDVLDGIGRASLPFNNTAPNQIAIGPPSTIAKPSAGGSGSSMVTTPTTVPTTPTTTPTMPTTPGQGHSTTTPTTAPPLIQLPVPLVTGPLGLILNPLLDPLIQALNNILAGKG